jgi:hypothetical protein
MNTSKLLILGSGWNPARLFGSSDLGAIQNPSNLASVAQEATGVTAGAVGSLVGLARDERYGLAIGADQATNGGFDSDTAWTKGAGCAITGGKMVFTAAAIANPNASQTMPIAASVLQHVTLTVSAYSAGSFYVRLYGTTPADGPTINANGTYSFYILAPSDATGLVGIRGATTLTLSIDDISVKPVPGAHAIQTTAGSRPTLNAGGKINYSAGAKSLVTTWPSSLGSSCTVGRSVPQGEATILTGQTIATTYTDTTDHCGLVIINRALSATETNQLLRWLNRRAG